MKVNSRVSALVARMPWLASVSLIYVISRLLSAGIVMVFAAHQPENVYTAAHPDYFSYANIWDARWYAYIAATGYPSVLPIDDAGFVTENAWAFLPVYPVIVGGLAALSGLGWNVAAVLVSLLAGWGSALVAYRLFRHFLPMSRSLIAIVFYCLAPVSPIFGFGYAEALFLLLLALSLLFLVQRQYLALAAVIPLLAFTRPGMLALALTIGLHFVFRWYRERGHWRAGLWLTAGGVTVWAGLWGFAWLVTAAVVTGNPSAYLETELAWRMPYVGRTELIPGTPWFESGDWWLGQPWGTIVPLMLVAGFTALVVSPYGRRIGLDLQLWLGSYALYLFLVFFPQSSVFRLLAPLFPVVAILAQVRSRVVLALIAVFGVVGQVLWLWTGWALVGVDWTPP